MTAIEAAKLTAKAKSAADMPYIYKQIQAAAEMGNNELFLPKLTTTPLQINLLASKGYMVAEVWDAAHDYLSGWKISWGDK